MLAKLGKLEKVSKLSYADYRALVKKEVNQRLSTATTTGIFQYVLLAGNSLTWKGDDSSAEEQPMLYLNENSQALIQSIKKSPDFDLNGYSYGSCKMVQIGTEVQVYLSPEKGKLTQAKLLKPIKKAFKKFKPKLFIEVVADLTTVEASVLEVEDTVIGDNENPENNPQVVARKIGQSLIKYHQAFQKVDKQAKSLPKEDENRNKVLVQRSKLLKHLKHLCNNWTEDVQPEAAELNLKDNWVKLYAHWTSFFEKRKAAKDGTSQDQTARAAEEERLYAKSITEYQLFVDSIKAGAKTDPIQIDEEMLSLKENLQQWKGFVKGKSSLSNELQKMEKDILDLETQWNEERKKMTAFHSALQKLKKAKAANASKDIIQKMYNRIEKLVHS